MNNYPTPKYKIGDIVIVYAIWGDPPGPQTDGQYLMGEIMGAYIYSGGWKYVISTVQTIEETDFAEDKIIQKL